MFKLGGLLSTGTLDPELAEKAVHLFTRRDYDTATFQAYKIVAVRARKVGKFVDHACGIDLIREGFNP